MKKPRKKLAKLGDCWLYAISSKRELAYRLSTDRAAVTEGDLKKLSAGSENYKLFTNKDGRAVQEPKRALQRVHMRLHELLSRVETPEYLHSARKGRSYLTNARSYNSDVPVIKIDVKKFFRSVPRVAVYDFFFTTMRCRKDVAGILADILTYNGHLPTGSSASPIISYYAFKAMFDDLQQLAESSSLKMTCYVDDITFSGEKANRLTLQRARQIIAAKGLKSHKLREFSSGQPKVITGVCNTLLGERVPNKLHQKISKGFEDLRSANTSVEKGAVLRPLLGRLEAASQIDRIFGARAKTLRKQTKYILKPL